MAGPIESPKKVSLSKTSVERVYQQTLEYMFSRLPIYQRVGAKAYKKDLTNTKALLEGLSSPEHHFRCIHIAGTNGKGSITHMLGSLFMTHGFKTGMYTSPHYLDFRERIKIGSTYISKEDVIDFIKRNKPLIEKIEPSFFELTVAMAFWYFAKEGVDMAIIETGLGGRLDSTNVITPELSIISNIGWDHMDMLGNTLPEIATEKAGIIKSGIPVVIGESLPETKEIFLKKTTELSSSIRFADEEYRIIDFKSSWRELKITVEKEGKSFTLKSDLSGPFQAKNIVTFLASADVLYEKGLLSDDQEKLTNALINVRLLTGFIGRWQVLGKAPIILADSAHNQDGLRYLFDELGKSTFQNMHIILGFVQDKDIAGVLPLFPTTATYYFAKADVPRGMNAKALQWSCKAYSLKGNSYKTVKNAFRAAQRNAEPQDLILVCGSIFVVAEVLPIKI